MLLSEYSEKISTKMSPQSLYLCGFPEVRVEMKVAPFRALTHSGSGFVVYLSSRVEMKVAPFRALTQIDSTIFMNIDYGRNEGCPF